MELRNQVAEPGNGIRSMTTLTLRLSDASPSLYAVVETDGFEPPMCIRTPALQAGAFSHSAKFPYPSYREGFAGFYRELAVANFSKLS